MKDIIEGPMDKQMLVIDDFAENYPSVLQDEVQGYNWINSQATISPCVVYDRFPVESNESTNLREISFIVISDHLLDTTLVVHYFQ